MSPSATDGYCYAISSGVSPSRKAATRVSSVTRVPPTRMTPSAPKTIGSVSTVSNSVISRSVLPDYRNGASPAASALRHLRAHLSQRRLHLFLAPVRADEQLLARSG